MRIYTLAAADGTPFAKRHQRVGDRLETTPFPNVRDVVSFEHNPEDLRALYEVLRTESEAQRCLLKGQLDRNLHNEPRAGHTAPDTQTEFLVLDLDFEDGFPSVDDFLQQLDPAFANVSYILHHSSGAGVRYQPGLRAHVIVLLDRPHAPAIIKQWLISRNMAMPALSERMELSSNGMGVKFPLDVSTCQNDKLIYIADPICDGVVDPLKEQRFRLIEKQHETLSINFGMLSAEQNRMAVDDKVTELRAKAGLKARKAKYKQYGSLEVLANPDRCTITGVKEVRGFTYLNLNGGDSWAYYFPTNQPHLVHNFKGEPSVFLRDIAPDFYTQLTEQQRAEGKKTRAMVFREPQSDTYFNALFNEKNQRMTLLAPVKSRDRMKDFLAQYGETLPDLIEDWTLEFNPTTNDVLKEPERWINRFQPSPYMVGKFIAPPKPPRIIDKVLRSICVDEETYDYFMNWLAYIFQTRKKTGIAWIFHGVPGTGKGILHEKILQPLFGRDHTPKVTAQQFREQFNAYQETAIILWLDEIKLDNSPAGDEIIDKLKNLITEETTTLRLMHRNPVTIKSYVNTILATNHPDPLPIDDHDRRFCIAPAQETPIKISQAEIRLIQDELPMFAGWLKHYQVDVDKAQRPLKNNARQTMILAGERSDHSFFRAIREGNLDYFLGYLRTKPVITPGNTYVEFERVIRRWATLRNVAHAKVSRDELMTVFAYLLNNTQITPAKFSRMCSIHRVPVKRVRVDADITQGTDVTFHLEDEELLAPLNKSNILEMNRA